MAPRPLQTPSYRFRTGVLLDKPGEADRAIDWPAVRLNAVLWVISIGGSITILKMAGVL